MTEEPNRSATPDDIEAALSDLRAGLGVPLPDDPRPEPPEKTEPPRRSSWLGQGILLIVAAGLGGGVAVMAPEVLGLKPPADQSAEQRFADIESRIARLPASAGGTADAAAYRDLSGKVATLEARLKAIETRPVASPVAPGAAAGVADTALSERVSGLEAGLGDLSRRVAGLDERLAAQAAAAPPQSGVPMVPAPPVIAPDTAGEIEAIRVGLAALEGRLAAVETGVPAPQLIAQLDRRISELEDTNPGRAARNAALSLVVTRLAEAADSGRPFAAELAAVKHLAPAMGDFSKVDGFAAEGLPTAAALAAQLQALDSKVRDAADADRGGDWFARFLRGMSRLIVITTDADPTGNEPEDRLVRAQRRAESGDIAQAVSELSGLSGAARQTVEPWLMAAGARLALSAAISQITGAILQDLTRTTP